MDENPAVGQDVDLGALPATAAALDEHGRALAADPPLVGRVEAVRVPRVGPEKVVRKPWGGHTPSWRTNWRALGKFLSEAVWLSRPHEMEPNSPSIP